MKTQESFRSKSAYAPAYLSILTLILMVGCAKGPTSSIDSVAPVQSESQLSQQSFSSLSSAAISGANLSLHFDSFAQVSGDESVVSPGGCAANLNCLPVSNPNLVSASGTGNISIAGLKTPSFATDISINYNSSIPNGAACFSLMQQALDNNLSLDMVVKGALAQDRLGGSITSTGGVSSTSGSRSAAPGSSVASSNAESINSVSVAIYEIESCTLGGAASPGAVGICGQGGRLCDQPAN